MCSINDVKLEGHKGPQRSTDAINRLHRLSTMMFISKVDEVLRVLIHLFPHILSRRGSWLYTRSITTTVMSVWHTQLKKAARSADTVQLVCPFVSLYYIVFKRTINTMNYRMGT